LVRQRLRSPCLTRSINRMPRVAVNRLVQRPLGPSSQNPCLFLRIQYETNEGACDAALEQKSDVPQSEALSPASPPLSESERLFNNWSIAMETLIHQFLDYISDTTGKKLDSLQALSCLAACRSCHALRNPTQSLYWLTIV
jgi:hypothetical protein